MEIFALITLVVLAVIHLLMAAVLGLYARYKVQYLSLAWIMGIFGFIVCLAMPAYPLITFEHVGLIHPYMLLALVVTSYLQTIYPLGITMPGYLQWQRMWNYAFPAIVLIILYLISILCGNRPQTLHSYAEVWATLRDVDTIFRIAAVLLSIYYVVNILRLPRLLARNVGIPRYVKGYASAVGLNTVYYMVISVMFSEILFYIYACLFTVLNMYLFFRTLETMAQSLPKPEIVAVKEIPTVEAIEVADKKDFNEANHRRFERVEYFMQQGREWEDNTFGRDRLCEATGINRHLLLQCLRSQGYNDCHEYISSYRLNALKRGVRDGFITSVNDCVVVGFGSVKTARSCFVKAEGRSLDDFIKEVNERRK